VTNPISGDNFPAQHALKEPQNDASAADRRPALRATGQHATPTTDLADVSRAHKRLSQEAEGARAPAIDSLDQARRQVARLRAQIAAEPRAAALAHGQADAELFEAAMARPTA